MRTKSWTHAGRHPASTPTTIGGITAASLRAVAVTVAVAALWIPTPGVGAVVAASGNSIVVPRDFPTIQAAIDAAAPGSTIRIRNGTYVEEIRIAKDLTLMGDDAGKTIIKSPAALAPFAQHQLNGKPVAAVVRTTDGARVRLSGVTVSGPTPCGVNTAGIRVVKGSTLKVSDTRVAAIHPAEIACPLDGIASSGIVVGLPEFILIDGEIDGGSIGHATITHVAVDRFLTTGIAVLGPFSGPVSTAAISDNVITGGTPFPSGQAGITVSFAATARVTGNTIRNAACNDVLCGRDPLSQIKSVGIATSLLAPGTVIHDNALSGNDVGIYLFGGEGCCEVRGNKIAGNRYFGILVQDGSNDTADNRITGGEIGVGVVADSVDTLVILRGDKIGGTSIQNVLEIECCGFTATAIVRKN